MLFRALILTYHHLYGSRFDFIVMCRESDDEEGDQPPAKVARVKTKDIQSFFSAKPKGKANGTARRKKAMVQPVVPLLRSMSLKRTTALL